MGEALREFWRGLCEAPRAFVAPLFAAPDLIRKVFEASDREQQNRDKRPIPN